MGRTRPARESPKHGRSASPAKGENDEIATALQLFPARNPPGRPHESPRIGRGLPRAAHQARAALGSNLLESPANVSNGGRDDLRCFENTVQHSLRNQQQRLTKIRARWY
jgi:hypothetical protein